MNMDKVELILPNPRSSLAAQLAKPGHEHGDNVSVYEPLRHHITSQNLPVAYQ